MGNGLACSIGFYFLKKISFDSTYYQWQLVHLKITEGGTLRSGASLINTKCLCAGSSFSGVLQDSTPMESMSIRKGHDFGLG